MARFMGSAAFFTDFQMRSELGRNRKSQIGSRKFQSRCPVTCFAFLLLMFVASSLPAAFVDETAAEFHASGDFNGDGRPDVLVLDKVTGNVRVGYQNASGALVWATSVPTRVPRASSLAVGGFLQANRDAIAVTSPELNRIHLLDLSTPGQISAPLVVNPPHPDLALLVALEDPYGTGTPSPDPEWLAAGAHDPGITLVDLLAYSVADGLARFQDQIAAEGYLSSARALQRRVGDATLLAAVRRGSNDTFVAYAYSDSSTPVLLRSGLASGTEYISGRFHNQTLAQVFFYVPGQSNLIVQPLVQRGASVEFGLATTASFPSSIERVYYLDEGTNGLAIVRFGNGISGLRPPTTGGTVEVAYGLGLGPAGNIVQGVVPLEPRRFALLSGGSNTFSSTQAQIVTKSASGYAVTSASTLTAASTSGTRANVWLYAGEPFVSPQPGFIASLNGGDWTTALTGLPGSVRVRVESDQSLTTGLGNAVTNTLGAPPAGALFSLGNQYHPAISLFSPVPPRAADPSRVTISPTPGSYSAPIQVTLQKVNPADQAFYRLGSGAAWTEYSTPIRVSNDVVIAYYGQTPAGARGAIQQAAYRIADGRLPSLLDTNNPTGTNVISGTNTEPFQLAAVGTVFYGRQSGSTGSVWAINLDGTADRFVTTGTRPRVSPNGRWLAFTREGAPFLSLGNLWLRDLTTGEERRLFNNPNFIVYYDWLNDSSGLVLDYECTVQRIDLAGVLTDFPMANDCFDDAPVVNPFDGRLAFHNLNAVPNRGLYQADASGATRQRYALGVAGPAWPAWSPDGARLSFADVRPGTGFGQNLFTTLADGSGLSPITGFADATNGFPFGALWSPGGDALIGAGSIRGQNGIWILPLNDTATACVGTPIRLPTTPGDLIDIVGSVRVGVALPRLFVQRKVGEVVVLWDRAAREFVLEAAASLEPGSDWVRIPGPYTLTGNFFEVHLPDAELAAASFFRLVRP